MSWTNPTIIRRTSGSETLLRRIDMRKQWVVVGILAGVLSAGDALAQHKQPNEQPNTAIAPEVPTGEVALGIVRIPRAVTADGKPLPAGSYTVRVTAQVAKPNAVGITSNCSWCRCASGLSVTWRPSSLQSSRAAPRAPLPSAPWRCRGSRAARTPWPFRSGRSSSPRSGSRSRSSRLDLMVPVPEQYGHGSVSCARGSASRACA
jgi:hypothetical protein